MSIEHQIKMYLADETQVYQDWYTTIAETEDRRSFTRQVDVIPSLSKLREMFARWIEQYKPKIKEPLCETFCRNQGQDREALLIAALADTLSTIISIPGVNVLAVSTILVNKKYLTTWCEC